MPFNGRDDRLRHSDCWSVDPDPTLVISIGDLHHDNMRNKRIVTLAAALAGGLLSLAAVASAQQPGEDRGFGVPARTSRVQQTGQPSGPAAALTDRPEDEKAIRAMGDAFTRAFGAGDAKSIAAMYTEDAEVIDELGERVQGRPAIEAALPRSVSIEARSGDRDLDRFAPFLEC